MTDTDRETLMETHCDDECFQCGGEGYVNGCSWGWQCDTWDEGDQSCLCERRCDVCNAKPSEALIFGQARGLSEAQRRLCVRAASDDYPINRRELQSAKLLKRKGLGGFLDTSYLKGGLLVYWNNETGLAVRKWIMENSDDN